MSLDAVDCIVVGAGLAGLSAAIELEKSGKSVLICDANTQPGGRVQSTTHKGYILDHGFKFV